MIFNNVDVFTVQEPIQKEIINKDRTKIEQ